MGRRRRSSAAPGTYRFALPIELRHVGSALFDQQMWCFGCDVRRPAGSLLLACGFARDGIPEGVKGGSGYRLSINADVTIRLWAWGVHYARLGAGSVFWKRMEFRPLWAAETHVPLGVYQPDQLPPFTSPQNVSEAAAVAQLSYELSLWMAQYERWVIDSFGLDYRADTLTGWQKKQPLALPAGEMIARWEDVAAMFSAFAAMTVNSPSQIEG